MRPGIRISKVWYDVDSVELQIEVSDGRSCFSNEVYVGHAELADAASVLDRFKDRVHGGLADIRFGEFGCEYANGAFHARFHFARPGRLYITCRLESAFEEFSNNKVASCATLYINSEPALLDRFIGELKAVVACERDEAHLEAI